MANSDARHTHRCHLSPALRLVVCLLPGWRSLPATANDFEAAGLASVVPSRTRMVTERVVLTQGAQNGHADATDLFHTPTAETITTTLALPEGGPPSETNGRVTGIDVDPLFRTLTTRGRGQPVQTRVEPRLRHRPAWLAARQCAGR